MEWSEIVEWSGMEWSGVEWFVGFHIISNSAGQPGQQIVDFPTIIDLALRRFSEQI